MSALLRYRLFGLTIASDFDLPELTIAAPNDAVDVHVVRDPDFAISDSGADPVEIEGGFAIRIAGVAAYEIRGGSEIRVAADPAAAPANVRLYLLGSAMGMLLHQRGLLPLHANAVVIDGRAIAFLGRSGAGKSTLAAAFHDRGFAVVSDDVCAVRFDERGSPTISPGLPRLRLWRDALIASGRDPADHAASYSGDPDYDKFDVAMRPAASDPLLLAGVIELRWGDEELLAPLTGLAGVEALIANTYRGGYVALLGHQHDHLQACVTVAATIPILALDRTPDLGMIPGHIDRFLEWERSLPTDTDR